MPNDESVHRAELPKLIDDGNTNNYGKWKTKSYHKLHEWDLLKYIKGPTSDPPTIPPLHEAREYHGLNEFNEIATVQDLSNVDKHSRALINAQPWMAGNNVTLAQIVTAIPALQLHLVQDVTYAKQAWESLRSFYQPHNSLHATSMKGQIMTYHCTSDMNVTSWLNDMQHLYNSLCDLETDHMSNREFTLAILDLMPQDNGWTDFISRL